MSSDRVTGAARLDVAGESCGSRVTLTTQEIVPDKTNPT